MLLRTYRAYQRTSAAFAVTPVICAAPEGCHFVVLHKCDATLAAAADQRPLTIAAIHVAAQLEAALL